MTATTYGFIGLGNMGVPMCGHLCDAGLPIIAYDAAGTAERAPAGAETANDLASVAAAADTIFLSLPDGAVVNDVAGEIALISNRRTTTVVDFSTTGPEAAAAEQASFRLASAVAVGLDDHRPVVAVTGRQDLPAGRALRDVAHVAVPDARVALEEALIVVRDHRQVDLRDHEVGGRRLADAALHLDVVAALPPQVAQRPEDVARLERAPLALVDQDEDAQDSPRPRRSPASGTRWGGSPCTTPAPSGSGGAPPPGSPRARCA